MSGEEEEEVRRQDLDAYCPRVDRQVFILQDTCFFPDKKAIVCRGCVFDGDFILAKLILLASEMLQDRGCKKGENSEKCTLEVEQK
jgi:hypothetical protein